MITKVTITGADNSILPEDLLELSKEYPFVEWGILVSKKNFGINRYPTMNWIKQLSNIKGLDLSCHLCGSYVRKLVVGDNEAIQDLGDLWNIFNRVQINTHGIKHTANTDLMVELLLKYPEKEFIFQYDDVNNEIIKYAHNGGVNCSALFDKSGGNGVLPDEWPHPLKDIKCGYAGGISPDNIDEQIKLIEEKAGGTNIWIDMETHVRSNNDTTFDVYKVIKCLDISKKYISLH